MRYVFFDSSALVKVYAWEGSGSRRVRDQVKSATLEKPTARILVCDFAFTETESALARKERDGDISSAEADRYIASVHADMIGEGPRPYQIIRASSVLGHAGSLARTHELRGMDSVQLAAALAARHAAPAGTEFRFACGDATLCDAARAEGFDVMELPAPTPGGAE